MQLIYKYIGKDLSSTLITDKKKKQMHSAELLTKHQLIQARA